MGSTGKRRAGGAARLGMRRTNRSFLVKQFSLTGSPGPFVAHQHRVETRTSPPPVFLSDGWSQSWPLIFPHRLSGARHYSLDAYMACWLIGSPRCLPYARPVWTSSRLGFQLRSIFRRPPSSHPSPLPEVPDALSIERPGCLR